MFEVTEAEMIATIATTRTSGAFGEFVNLPEFDAARVVLKTGLTVIVRRVSIFWSVSFKGMEGVDADCENTARLALEAGRGVSTTRNYRI